MKNLSKLIVPGVLSLVASTAVSAAEETPSINFSGRIQADSTDYHSDDYDYTDGTEVRRLRAGVSGDLTSDWSYKMEYEFAPDTPEVKDVYLRYTGIENTRINIGNYKVYSSLEELTSSNNMTFTERGLPNAMVTSRRVALGYQTWSDRFSFAAAAYTHEANNLDRGTGAAARFSYRPQIGGGALLHLGLNAALEHPDNDAGRVRTRPELHQDSHRIIDTGAFNDVDDTLKLGLEAAYVNGRFSAQSEYLQKSFSRSNSSDATFNGFYAYVSYFLTNDTRAYSTVDGIFSTITPASGAGAWEVAARVSSLDLNDGGVRGGVADALTLAVNYYMTRDLRFQANYVFTDTDRGAFSEEPEGLQMRVRFTF